MAKKQAKTTKRHIVKDEKLELIPSSGNVYEDLGFKDAKQRLAKAQLASRINDLIDEKGLKQVEAARLLGINQPKISALLNGRLQGFSIGRLFTFLLCLGQDIKIVLKPSPKQGSKSRLKQRQHRGVWRKSELRVIAEV